MSDLYTLITERIVEQLQAGTPPWVKPWSTIGDPVPTNAISRRAYRGVNLLLLSMQQQACGYASNVWMTFRQAQQLGGCVRKGEHGATVVYYDLKTIKEDDTQEERRVPLLRLFTVFNTAQVDGLPEYLQVAPVTDPEWRRGELAEEIIKASGARIIGGGFKAYYSPANDRIYLPARSMFTDEPGFYGTVLHELAHWSGHPTRLNRQFGKRFGDAAYAMEELLAELTAAFLCAHCRIDGRLQHASYIASWLEVLGRDKRALFTAAAQAQKAADLLIAQAKPELAEAVAIAA
jgi:antirestriction protein ArdC